MLLQQEEEEHDDGGGDHGGVFSLKHAWATSPEISIYCCIVKFW